MLASASPRRAALLRSVGLAPTVAPVRCDETPLAGEFAVAYARRIAAAKLNAAIAARPREHADAVIIVADTVVWDHERTPLGKPRDVEHAAQMLGRLTAAGTHHVTTAWALGWPEHRVHAEQTTTLVAMRTPEAAELSAYLASGQWRDKAGGYGIQDHAAAFVTRIEGSYTNVVGLPVAQVLAALLRAPTPPRPPQPRPAPPP